MSKLDGKTPHFQRVALAGQQLVRVAEALPVGANAGHRAAAVVPT